MAQKPNLATAMQTIMLIRNSKNESESNMKLKLVIATPAPMIISAQRIIKGKKLVKHSLQQRKVC
jgi:hypothetical protein